MTSPTSDPRGLGVGPDTIRRWQDRGLIRGRVGRLPRRPNRDVDHSSGETPSVAFPPINEIAGSRTTREFPRPRRS
jgi:hypothetical protein